MKHGRVKDSECNVSKLSTNVISTSLLKAKFRVDTDVSQPLTVAMLSRILCTVILIAF